MIFTWHVFLELSQVVFFVFLQFLLSSLSLISSSDILAFIDDRNQKELISITSVLCLIQFNLSRTLTQWSTPKVDEEGLIFLCRFKDTSFSYL